MQKRTKKVTAAVSAAVLAAATLLGGTFAWQSVSQKAINETVREVNPGARLHDDFDGTNKDIYVENFTAPESGKPVFVRVRLDEYMESGEDAGTNRAAGDRDAVPLVKDADINDPATWRVHLPNDADDPFHKYWAWETGGSTVYMPTFNKNKDSLAPDINGTYEGITPDDGINYDDYVTYQVGDTETANAYYDADKDDTDEGGGTGLGNGGDLNINYNQIEEEHTAKNTRDATVLTMEEWMDMGSPVGNYWVWDEDGWAYWAAPVMPGESTGLLLSQITSKAASGERWYYAINVVGQFADANGWGSEEDGTGFYDDSEGVPPTENAENLLNQAASVVVGANGEWYLPQGSNVYEKIDDSTGASEGLVCAGMDTTIGNDDDKTNVVKLEPADENFGSWFLGPDDDDCYLAVGPDGLLGTEDDVLVISSSEGDDNSLNDLIEAPVTISITPSVGKELGTDLKAYAGDQVPFGVTATLNSKPVDDSKVTWTVTGDKTADTSISNGQLTIGAGQASGSVLTVTAKYKNKTDSVQLTVTDAVLGYSDIHSVVPGATTKLFIDDYHWYVLAKDNVDSQGQTEALLWSVEGTIKSISWAPVNSWVGSPTQTRELPAWLEARATLKDHCVPVHLYSRNISLVNWDESDDKIFLLTEADLFGTERGTSTEDQRNYTYKVDGVGQILVPNIEMRKNDGYMTHLRDYYTELYLAGVLPDGTLSVNYVGASKIYLRAAMWVTFN